jgi:hypothetical protein
VAEGSNPSYATTEGQSSVKTGEGEASSLKTLHGLVAGSGTPGLTVNQVLRP